MRPVLIAHIHPGDDPCFTPCIDTSLQKKTWKFVTEW